MDFHDDDDEFTKGVSRHFCLFPRLLCIFFPKIIFYYGEKVIFFKIFVNWWCDISENLKIVQSEEAVVDKDTGKVSVELRCGPFPFQSPSYPIQWQVKNKDVLFIIAISKSLFCFVKFSLRHFSFLFFSLIHGKILLTGERVVKKHFNKYETKDFDNVVRKFNDCYLVETSVNFAGIEKKK